jgi:DNA-binding GntR family transcriptional regulator
MDKTLSWAEFHDLDAEFHRAAAAASGLTSTAKRYAGVLGELYGYFLPYPVEFLRESNREHAALVDALTRQDPAEAVQLTCEHVEALHETMFVGLTPRA